MASELKSWLDPSQLFAPILNTLGGVTRWQLTKSQTGGMPDAEIAGSTFMSERLLRAFQLVPAFRRFCSCLGLRLAAALLGKSLGV